MLNQLTIDDFESLIDQEITILFGDTNQKALVSSVQRTGTGTPDGRMPFSVVVESGEADRYWPQGMYRLDHPDHGALELFMVPIGPERDRMRYEINFS